MQQRDASDQDDDGDDDGGFDLGMVVDYLGYALRAVRLHKLLTGGIFVGVVAVAFLVLQALPKMYHVESKLLAQRDAMAGHGNPYGWDPLKGANDVVMSHDHLAMLVKQLELTAWWREHQAPAQRLKSAVMGLFGRPPTEEDQARALIEMLGTKLNVYQNDNTVVFTCDWTSGEMAARLIDTAEQNFLEKRHVLEISTIAESISILEDNAARVRKEVEGMTGGGKDHPPEEHAAPEKAATDGDKKEPAARLAPSPAPAHRAPARRRPEVDAELARQKVMIETKQRAITDLDDFRQRRVLELQASLAEQSAKYTDQHPIIVGIRENIATFSKESPQVASLRADVKTLQDAYDRLSHEAEPTDAPAGGRVTSGGPAQVAAVNEAPLVVPPSDDRDPTMATQITYAVANYAKIRSDIDAAKVDLDFAQAAFRHRYSVSLPAEPPKGPSSPKIPLMMGAAAGLALLLGVLAAVAVELRSGRFVNRWQVERLLKLPVLAELHLPGGPGTPPPADRS